MRETEGFASRETTRFAAGGRIVSGKRISALLLGVLIWTSGAAFPLRAQETFIPTDLLFRDGTLQYFPLREFDLGDIETGDVNGDGLADIVFSIARSDPDSIPGTVPRVWIQNSLHRFYDETAFRIPPLSSSTFDLDLFDAEGDGDLDILLCGYRNASARSVATLLINDGAGFFTDESAQRIIAVPEYNIISFAEPARIDSDAYTDIAAVLLNDADPHNPFTFPMLLMNTGDGHFWPDTRGRLGGAGAYGYFNVEAADFTGDSLADLLFLNNALPGDGLSGQLALFRNTGNGFMADETAARMGNDSLRSTRDVAIGDADGDGDRDILDVGTYSAANDPQVRLLLNDGSGFFTPEAGGAIDTLAGIFNDAEFAPMMQDALPDLFIAKVRAGIQSPDVLLLNRGDGSFRDSSALLPSVIDFTTAAAVCDYDNDGDFDVITGNGSPVSGEPGQNRLYINQRRSPSTDAGEAGGIARGTSLAQNYPNPFNPSTVIRYSLAEGADVTITAVNLLGAEVLRAQAGRRPPGVHEFRWNAEGLPAGVYFYTVIADGVRLTPRAALLIK